MNTVLEKSHNGVTYELATAPKGKLVIKADGKRLTPSAACEAAFNIFGMDIDHATFTHKHAAKGVECAINGIL